MRPDEAGEKKKEYIKKLLHNRQRIAFVQQFFQSDQSPFALVYA